MRNPAVWYDMLLITNKEWGLKAMKVAGTFSRQEKIRLERRKVEDSNLQQGGAKANDATWHWKSERIKEVIKEVYMMIRLQRNGYSTN